MIVDQQFIESRLMAHLEETKRELEASRKPSDGTMTTVTPKAVVIRQDGRESLAFLPWHNSAEKYAWTAAASKAAAMVGAAALMVRTIATMIRDERVLPILGMTAQEAQENDEEFDRRLWKWVAMETGGSRLLGYLPRKYTYDAVLLAAIGPGLPDIAISQPFIWAEGKVAYITTRPGAGVPCHHVEIPLIPKWWC